MMVQEEIVRRASVKTGTGKRRVYSGKYALSSLMFCAHCGDIFQRTQWIVKGEHVPVWRCVSRLQKRKSGIDCSSRTIYETDLHKAVVKGFNYLIKQKDELLPVFKANVEKALSSSNSEAVAEVDRELLVLQKELLERSNTKLRFGDDIDALQEKIDTLQDQIDTLRDKKRRLLLEDANKAGVRQQIDRIERFIGEHQETGITEFDEALVRKHLSKITIYDEKLVFEFKGGIEVEVKEF